MSTGMTARMAMMRMQMKCKKHRKPRMDQRRMWRTEGIVLQSVEIGSVSNGSKFPGWFRVRF